MISQEEFYGRLATITPPVNYDEVPILLNRGVRNYVIDITTNSITNATVIPNESYSSFLLKGIHDNDNSLRFYDYSPLHSAIEPRGGCAIDASVQDPYGNGEGAIAFDGVGSYIFVESEKSGHVGWATDFTVSLWANFSSNSDSQFLISMVQPYTNAGWRLMYDTESSAPTNKLVFGAGTSTADNLEYNWTPTVGTWYYLTVSKVGRTLRLFIDGVVVATNTNWTGSDGISYILSGYHNMSLTTEQDYSLHIGWNPQTWFLTSGYFYGSMSDIHIQKGIGYSSITVPTDRVSAIADRRFPDGWNAWLSLKGTAFTSIQGDGRFLGYLANNINMTIYKAGNFWILSQAKTTYMQPSSGTPDPYTTNAYITSDQAGFNFRTWYDDKYPGYDGVTPVTMNVYINEGVRIVSTNAATPAFDTGTWPAGSSLRIYNSGTIFAAGGSGGVGGYSKSLSNAVKGGTAIKASIPITLSNITGVIRAGGGGGGGHWDDLSAASFGSGGGGGGIIAGFGSGVGATKGENGRGCTPGSGNETDADPQYWGAYGGTPGSHGENIYEAVPRGVSVNDQGIPGAPGLLVENAQVYDSTLGRYYLQWDTVETLTVTQGRLAGLIRSAPTDVNTGDLDLYYTTGNNDVFDAIDIDLLFLSLAYPLASGTWRVNIRVGADTILRTFRRTKKDPNSSPSLLETPATVYIPNSASIHDVRIYNYGTIAGKGGDGGRGTGVSAAADGEDGGTAIKADGPVTIENYGTIAGGGGGGGGVSLVSPYDALYVGGGGGGGQGYGQGNGGAGHTVEVAGINGSGIAATPDAPGEGGLTFDVTEANYAQEVGIGQSLVTGYWLTHRLPGSKGGGSVTTWVERSSELHFPSPQTLTTGGAGGAYGEAGESGAYSTGATPTSGGAAGKYAEGNSNITWTVAGTLVGGFS